MSIKTKITIAGAGLLVLLAMACYTLFGLWQTEKAARERMFGNVTAMAQGTKFNADSTQAQVKALVMQIKEVKKAFPELKAELKAHGVKLNKMEQYQESMLGVSASFNAEIKKKIDGRDTSLLVSYTDKWLHYISTQKQGDTTASVDFKMDVDLQQVIHRQRQPGFWGFLKKKELVQDMWTDNPHAKINYNRLIKVN
ncbi:MAG TPA: DUF6549 family protein [Williamwhitmania sp.]|nr:DUF6549 family protein [Williamwhitmania sp.]